MRRFFSHIDLSKYTKLIRGDEGFGKYAPKAFSPWLLEFLELNADAVDIKAATNALAIPTHDLMSNKANLWRGSLCMALSEGLGGTAERVLPLAVSIELLHNGTLLVDDLQDKRPVRKGKPATHQNYGTATAINLRSWLLFLPLHIIQGLTLPEPIRYSLVNQVIENHSRHAVGQALDLQWHREGVLPTSEEYLYAVKEKVAIIPKLAVVFATSANSASSEVTQQLLSYGENLGIAYQLREDSPGKIDDRGFIGEDITEGRRTAIAIRAAASSPRRDRFLEILKSKATDAAVVAEALDIIRGTDALEWNQGLAREYADRALASLRTTHLQPSGNDFLEKLANFAVTRSV
mmetsp:Transcript_22519/g.40582  ORF Transcript_22519/g.40582 Transcript_22519/m.40582 type:complete len:349 (+) Transcript_22519:7160-8206(+)